MTALALASLALLARLPAPDPVWRLGDRVEARVEIRMTNRAEEVDLTELETWTLAITKVEADAVQATLARELLETRLNGAYAGPPAGGPRVEPWTFRPDGSLAFRPRATTALEGRLYRLLDALLPTPGSDPAGRPSVEFPDEPTLGLSSAVLAANLRRREGPLRPVDVTYREADVRLGGLVSVDPQNGWPLFAALRIAGLRLEGGEIAVDTVVTMTATKAKIRGENVGLPEKKADPKRPG